MYIFFLVSGNVECGTLLGIMGPRLVVTKYNVMYFYDIINVNLYFIIFNKVVQERLHLWQLLVIELKVRVHIRKR